VLEAIAALSVVRHGVGERNQKTKETCLGTVFATVALLICSNVFITFVWYPHLQRLGGQPWFIAAVISREIALFEYMFQIGKPHRVHTFEPLAT